MKNYTPPFVLYKPTIEDFIEEAKHHTKCVYVQSIRKREEDTSCNYDVIVSCWIGDNRVMKLAVNVGNAYPPDTEHTKKVVERWNKTEKLLIEKLRAGGIPEVLQGIIDYKPNWGAPPKEEAPLEKHIRENTDTPIGESLGG